MTVAIRTALRVLLPVALLLAAVAVHPAPARAATCAEAIINDWSDADGKIDGQYPIHCYREAIAALPGDLRYYSSAGDDIRQALLERLQATSGSTGATGDAAGGSGSASGGTREPTSDGNGNEKDAAGAAGAQGNGPGDGSGGQGNAGGGQRLAAPSNEAFGRQIGDGGGSLPVPLIVLASVGGALALGAGAWFVRRQLAARR